MTSVAAPLERLTRRRFLRWTLLGGAGVLAAGGGAFALLRRSPVDDLPLPAGIHHLSASEYQLFRRAVAVLLPAAEPLPAPASLPVLPTIDHLVGLLAAPVRRDLRAGLAVFDHAALVSGWHGRRFVDLDDAAARAYFDAWAAGNMLQRALSATVKKLVYAAYWSQPQTWAPLEFDGPVSDRWGLVARGNAPMPDSERKPA